MFGRWDAKLALLQDVALFDGCGRRQIRAIGGLGDLLSVAAGTALTHEGGSAGEAFVLVGGSVTVSRNGQVIATLGPGDVVGELALVDRGRRNATVTATTDVELLVFDPRSFARLMDEAPGVGRRIAAAASRRRAPVDRERQVTLVP